MNALSVCIAINIAADELAGGEGRAPGVLRCLCTYCLEDLDPRAELTARRAPDHFECLECGQPERERLGGLVFVTFPRAAIARSSELAQEVATR